MDRYQPLSNYGVIGNLQTAALISGVGTLDWLCLPHFDSPSLFAALLDSEKGGSFAIAPSILFTSELAYEPFSNVLVTRFVTASGGAEVVDFMPPYTEAGVRGKLYHPALYRGIRGLWGEVPFRVVCDPRPDYGRVRAKTDLAEHGAVIRGGGMSLGLAAEVALQKEASGVGTAFSVPHGTERWFVLRQCAHAGCDPADLLAPADYCADLTYRRVLDFWRRWADQCRYQGRWRQEVIRSALVIKLLTFGPTGALVAAPTTSLPHTLGGSLNQDYRYCWLRDSALAVNALLRLGYTEEAQAFFGWLEARSLEPGGLRGLYGVDGQRGAPEETLPHLEGYRGSAPVRIGNAAHGQRHLHVYGELLSAFSLLARQRKRLPRKIWTALRRAVDDLCEEWQKPDAGIWDVTGEPRHFVHSKLMAWTALDRAIGLLDPLGPGVAFTTALAEGIRRLVRREQPVVERWTKTKEAIAREILERGWHSRRGAFTQSYGSDLLDASLLLLPSCRFLPAEDERVHATVDRLRQELTVGGLMRRYESLDSPPEGAFTPCSFWLVDALAAIGKMAEATSLFEATLAQANHLGLYSEEIDPATGEFLGHFPQGLTHLSLIGSALTLEGS